MLRIGDAFCGMGVLGYAAHLELLDRNPLTVWAANSNAQAVAAHAAFYNSAGIPVLRRECADLLHYGVGSLPKVDLLIAGPSCPAFSQAAQPGRASSSYCRDRHDVLRMTPMAIHDLVDGSRPGRVLVENVLDMASWELFDYWVGGFEARGYQTATIVLRDSACGGWQDRDRLFTCAWKTGPAPYSEEMYRGVSGTSALGTGEDPRGWEDAIDWNRGRWKTYTGAPAGPLRRLQRALDRSTITERLVRYASRGPSQHQPKYAIFIQNVTGHAGRMPGTPTPTLTTGDQFGVWKQQDYGAPWQYRVWSAREQARLVLDGVTLLPKMRKKDLVTFLGNAVPVTLGRAAVRWAMGAG